MNKVLLFSVGLAVMLSGCALLNKLAPSSYTEVGQPLPGTHELSPIAKTATDAAGPYGQAAAAIILMAWNFVERAKAKKNGEGLKATLSGLKSAAEDPATKAAFQQVKLYLKNAHDSAGVRKDIDLLLAKI